MTQEFVSYEQALALKELGFDEPCFGLFTRLNNQLLIKEMPDQQECEQYFGGILAPTFSQTLRWFRNQDFIIDISSDENRYYGQNNKNCQYSYCISFSEATIFSDLYDSYEEAETSCIDKLIELLKHFQVQNDNIVYLKKN